MAHAAYRLGFQHQLEFVVYFPNARLQVGHTPFEALALFGRGLGRQPPPNWRNSTRT